MGSENKYYTEKECTGTLEKCIPIFDPLPPIYVDDVKPEGEKFDTGKLMYSLIEPDFLKGLARVLTFGAQKYSPDNWKHVDNFKQRYTDALYRHLEAWRGGECIDPDSGCHHLLHVGCNVMFLLWGERNGK